MSTITWYSRAGKTTTMGMLAAAVLAAPSAGQAGQAEDWAVRRAQRMETEARALADERERWEHAAWLYRQAATLRPQGDPEAVIDLQAAGRLSYYTGDLKQSVTDLRAAAERSGEGGDVLTTGSLLVDAAWVAGKLGRYEEARRYILQAERTLAAPVLSPAVRNTVLSRIDRTGDGILIVASELSSERVTVGP